MAEDSSSKRTRASGEVLELLLREFDKNQNPSPDQRRDISERTNMSEKAVRIWFQNRRAKLRKFERLGKPVKGAGALGSGSASSLAANGARNSQRLAGFSGYSGSSSQLSRSNSYTSVSALQMHSALPVELNEKYCFVDCLSLSVGSWQRIKSGSHDSSLPQALVNLAPFTLNKAMTNVDLMVILLRKNQEINYFFLAILNHSKILFRIFYPIGSILQCSLLDNNIHKESNELRLNLARKPKFSVFFFDSVNSNLNQWSICEDFSEGQQVSNAFYAPGGSSMPHVLVGPKHALLYLKSFIAEHNIQQRQQHQQLPFDNHRIQSLNDIHLHGSTPTVSSDYQLAAISSGEKWFDDGSVEHGDLQIKHDSWDALSQGEGNFSQNSARPPFEAHPLFQHLAHQANENEEDILATTPDFFSANQTPGSNVASGNVDDERLMPSPTAHITTNSEKRNRGSNSGPSTADDGSYTQLSRLPEEYHSEHGFGDENHQENHELNVYDFDLQQGQNEDFQHADLLIHSPELNTHDTPGASAANQVDTFIDYSSHY